MVSHTAHSIIFQIVFLAVSFNEVPGINHWPAASHITSVVIGTDCTTNISNYFTIMAMIDKICVDNHLLMRYSWP